MVCCADDATANLAAARPAVRTYGFAPGAHYRIVDEQAGAYGCRFTLEVDGEPRGELAVPLGVKAATNAAGAAALALELGVDVDAVAPKRSRLRRCRPAVQIRRGERDGVTFVDDYAHLPSEVTAAIATARRGPWERVIAVFQPHRYSRTASIGRDFADAFTAADAVVLTDVYAAGETPIPGVSGRLVLHAVLDKHPALPVTSRRADLRSVPVRMSRRGDVVLTLGAGDLTTMPDVWLGRHAAPVDIAEEDHP